MKILIVDDDIGIQNALKAGLVSFGYRVIVAEEANEALKILKDFAAIKDPIDLLITDLRMPGIDGLELIRLARIISPALKTLLMTAYGNDDIRKAVDLLGACGYLEKPFSPNNALQLINEYLGTSIG